MGAGPWIASSSLLAMTGGEVVIASEGAINRLCRWIDSHCPFIQAESPPAMIKAAGTARLCRVAALPAMTKEGVVIASRVVTFRKTRSLRAKRGNPEA